MTTRVFIHTFGCQMNMLDSDKMYALLARDGYERVDSPEEADLILVNTCSVRAKAVQKLYSLLGRLRARQDLTRVTVGVTGCVAQHEREALARRFPFVNLVMGPDAIPRIGALAAKARATRTLVLDVGVDDGLEYPFVSALPPPGEGPVPTAFVTIQKGCDNRCAYCIVPATRGPEVSRPPGDIVAEVQALADRGVKEVTLLGQNVNAYGRKARLGVTFPELLHHVAEVRGIERIRFTTSHPRDLSPALIEAFADNPKLCPHIHLPVQSGASRILARMGRGYTRDTYLERIEALRAATPDIGITTDFIVGFPGETDEEFEETLSLLEIVRFDASFSFAFSPRPGTRAARDKDTVPPETRAHRLARLQTLQRRISAENNQRLVDTTQDVLVEGLSRQSDHDVTGRTLDNRTVNFPGTKAIIGEIVQVEIIDSGVNSLRGARVPG